MVELNNGTTFIFPAHLCQGLTEATEEELADVTISPSGGGLLWDRLDAGPFGRKMSGFEKLTFEPMLV